MQSLLKYFSTWRWYLQYVAPTCIWNRQSVINKYTQINDTVVNLPYVNNQSGINIRFSGRMIVLVTSFGLKISYDGSSYLRVEIPGYLSGQVEGLRRWKWNKHFSCSKCDVIGCIMNDFRLGLCGNFNGNPNDDFMNRTSGDLIASISQFANQYRSSEME